VLFFIDKIASEHTLLRKPVTNLSPFLFYDN